VDSWSKITLVELGGDTYFAYYALSKLLLVLDKDVIESNFGSGNPQAM